MKKQLITLFVALLCISGSARAAKVDTLSVHSNAMDKGVTVVAIRPDKAVAGEKCPVVYLLHGHGGNAFTWIGIKPELPRIADRDGVIFICPDGKNSWYWDSPLNKDYRYETFVSKELVDYVDSHFATKADRDHRVITGLSMGGHGSMWLSIRHKETFGAAGSMSGGLDIRPFPNSWEMKLQLGEEASNRSVWDSHTVINQLDKIEDGDLAIIIDCGSDDFFLEVNKAVHEKLLAKKIGHDFTVRPGAHNGKYWGNAIDYHLLFFKKFFNKSK
ncbi:alpha/beta hydrolase [Phocaeicola sp.]